MDSAGHLFPSAGHLCPAFAVRPERQCEACGVSTTYVMPYATADIRSQTYRPGKLVISSLIDTLCNSRIVMVVDAALSLTVRSESQSAER